MMTTKNLTQADIEALVDEIQQECNLGRMHAWCELRRRDPDAFDQYFDAMDERAA